MSGGSIQITVWLQWTSLIAGGKYIVENNDQLLSKVIGVDHLINVQYVLVSLSLLTCDLKKKAVFFT